VPPHKFTENFRLTQSHPLAKRYWYGTVQVLVRTLVQRAGEELRKQLSQVNRGGNLAQPTDNSLSEEANMACPCSCLMGWHWLLTERDFMEAPVQEATKSPSPPACLPPTQAQAPQLAFASHQCIFHGNLGHLNFLRPPPTPPPHNPMPWLGKWRERTSKALLVATVAGVGSAHCPEPRFGTGVLSLG